MPLGSSIAFSDFMTAIVDSPSSEGNKWRLPIPTPCSPVQVPPTANARLYKNTSYSLQTYTCASFFVISYLLTDAYQIKYHFIFTYIDKSLNYLPFHYFTDIDEYQITCNFSFIDIDEY